MTKRNALLLQYLVVTCCLLWASGCRALDIKRVWWKNHFVLAASGEVVQGDAQRISDALTAIQPLAHGLPVILLNSPGGSVAEALKISDVFSHNKVHTVVPTGANCASACASIVFIAGTNRTIEEGGQLGQHSCSLAGVKDQQCNDIIASHALTKGVSFGSIQAFISYVAPQDILWFSRSQADCYGITKYPFTDESGFEKSEPCVIKFLTGKYPAPQAAWRVDFYSTGYRAFLRPVADHMREMELGVFCRDDNPGVLFVSMTIEGSSEVIKNAITGVSIIASPVNYASPPYSIIEADEQSSEVLVALGKGDVRRFLRSANELSFKVDVKSPFKPMVASAPLTESRNALLFAANNCVKRIKE